MTSTALAAQAPQAPRDDRALLGAAIEHYIDHPVQWVEDILNGEYDPWQADGIEKLIERRFVSIRSGHGVGKTFFLATVVLYFLSTRPFCRILCTSPTKEQLFDVLWAELAERIRESAVLSSLLRWMNDRIVVRSHPAEWFAVARTAEVQKNRGPNDLSTVEALQGRHGDTIVVLLDEASGIHSQVISAIWGALTNDDSYVVMTGNPTKLSGEFYDSFHSRSNLWYNIHVNAEDSPRVSKNWIRLILDQCRGDRDHPIYRVKVRGEFPIQSKYSLFSIEAIDEAMAGPHPEPARNAPIYLGVDVAAGGTNLSCICTYADGIVSPIEKFNHRSTMETTGNVVSTTQRLGPKEVRVDRVGVGAGVHDRMIELGYKNVVGINGGSAAQDPKQFVNLRSENYWHLHTLVEDRKIRLPADDNLKAQMLSVTWAPTSTGKIRIATKDEMATDLGLPSPDELDSVVMACANLRGVVAAKRPMRPSSWRTIGYMAR